jgi:hypothetical protein
MKKSLLVACLLAISLISSVDATTRSAKVRKEFVKTHPCPAKVEHSKTTCPGFVVDHIIPLCAGGKDAIENMQWQTKEESYKKDKFERSQCASLKKAAVTAKPPASAASK